MSSSAKCQGLISLKKFFGVAAAASVLAVGIGSPAFAATVTYGEKTCSLGSVYVKGTANHRMELNIWKGTSVDSKVYGSTGDPTFRSGTNYSTWAYSTKQEVISSGTISASGRGCDS